MPFRSLSVLSLVVCLACNAPAEAQGVVPQMSPTQAPASSRARPDVLDKTCARDLDRFCPELAGTGQLRNQLICLRPYRIDLALPCHRAVAAASR